MAKTILLADDSVTIQKVVELTFMDQDYRVIAVSKGDDALARLAETDPDLLIADVHMPGADGYEVCRRAKEARPELPVLLLVGTFEPFDEQEAAAAGADGHLKKPFDSQDLLSQVEALVGGTTADAGPSGGAPPESEAGDAPAARSPDIFDLEPPALTQEEVSTVSEAASEVAVEPPRAEAPPGDVRPPEAPPSEPRLPGGTTPFPLGGAPPAGASDVPPPPAPSEEPIFESLAARAPEPEFAGSEDTSPIALVDGGADFAAAAEPAPEAGAAGEPFDLPSGTPPSGEPAPGSPAPAASAGFGRTGEVEETRPMASRAAASGEAPAADDALAADDAPAAAATAAGNGDATLSDGDVDRIARRVAELIGDKALREVAWEVVPDLAELIIKERIRELESQVE